MRARRTVLFFECLLSLVEAGVISGFTIMYYLYHFMLSYRARRKPRLLLLFDGVLLLRFDTRQFLALLL